MNTVNQKHYSLQLIVLSVVFFIVLLLGGCTSLFFEPGRQFVDSPEVREHAPLDVYFRSPDGVTLHGWYFRAKEDRGTVLVYHGNAENISTHVKLDLWLIDAGYNLFIFDYRGYGRSEGSPDIKGMHLDAEAALETLLFRLPRARRDRIIVLGKSLGGALAVYTVAHSPYKDRVKALILDSSFSSYRAIARDKIADTVIGWPFQYPLSYLVNDDYSPVECIGRVSPVPVVIIHGDDTIVPGYHSLALFDAAIAPRELWSFALPGHVLVHQNEHTQKKLLFYLELLP